jgi:hypothetical protein
MYPLCVRGQVLKGLISWIWIFNDNICWFMSRLFHLSTWFVKVSKFDLQKIFPVQYEIRSRLLYDGLCLAVQQLRLSVRERVLDKFGNPFIYKIVEFITINKWLCKVFLV